MKIRIRENSIRLRLTQPELESFANEGYIESKTNFGFSEFVYALQSLDSIEKLASTYIGNKITVFMPAQMKTEWANTDIVGYGDAMNISNGQTLNILVEKDWACADNSSDEDQSDNFPNPHAAC